MNGRNIFMGYLHMKDKTLETVDDEWWLKSGDVGRKDEDGYLYITGRIKGVWQHWKHCNRLKHFIM